MNTKQKIEEILLNDFGCFDDFTVDKLLDLFSVVGQSEQLCECKCEYPIIRTGVTEYCSICQLEVK